MGLHPIKKGNRNMYLEKEVSKLIERQRKEGRM